jgi:hypothetical protein
MKITVTIEGYISNVSSTLDTNSLSNDDLKERSLAEEWFSSLLDSARVWDDEETSGEKEEEE